MAKLTAELTGTALDWAVCKCLGEPYSPVTTYNGIGMDSPATLYSADWSLAGPIIEREGIAIRRHTSGTWYAMLSADLGDSVQASWRQQIYRGGVRYGVLSYQVHPRHIRFDGPSPLIAAMRCLVASRLGILVETPADLVPDATAA